MGLAESGADSVNGMRHGADQVVNFIRMLGRVPSQPSAYPVGQLDDLVELSRSALGRDQCFVGPFETRVPERNGAFELTGRDGVVDVRQTVVQPIGVPRLHGDLRDRTLATGLHAADLDSDVGLNFRDRIKDLGHHCGSSSWIEIAKDVVEELFAAR
jgi:hypothetical protein